MEKLTLVDILSNEKTDKSIVLEWSNQFSIFAKDNTTELDFKLISLTHKVAEKLFGSIQNLYNFPLTIAHSYGGVDAEIKVS